ncbi:MAG TPA: metal-dependent hydrolase [Dongiaceae bacterium]|nr:metal-dependent hydrolase [Dongiaceae bacterium]
MVTSTADPWRQRFLTLLAPWTSAAGAAPWYHALRTRYDEPQRHYHTFAHIEACLRHLDAVRPQLRKPATVELALWFHDVIYDPRAKDNEARSADFARSALQACQVDSVLIAEVERLILLTCHTETPPDLDPDARYLLDIDLAILGAETTLYDRYETWVRQEYAHVPLILFRWGRKRLLRHFLSQPALYTTEHFRSQFEDQARLNLRRAITAL